MRVHVVPADHGGCGFYRLRLPASVTSLATTVSTELVVGRDLAGRVRDVRVDADVVVLQRPAHQWQLDAIRVMQAQGVRVVLDMDDDFTCLHPSNPAKQAGTAEMMAKACQLADLVTVSTPALARRYGSHGRVVVLPNCVPGWYLDVDAAKDRGVGWSGSVHTHPDDLEVTRGAVGRTVSDFHVIGTGEGVKRGLGLRDEPSMTGWVPLEAYPREVARLTVGLVPLVDTQFNRAKSALKMAEYASLGVVPVVSPTPDNLRLHADGVGLVAKRPRDWQRHLRTLLHDDGLRADMAARGRELMAAHTVEANIWRWEQAWTSTSVAATTPLPVG